MDMYAGERRPALAGADRRHPRAALQPPCGSCSRRGARSMGPMPSGARFGRRWRPSSSRYSATLPALGYQPGRPCRGVRSRSAPRSYWRARVLGSRRRPARGRNRAALAMEPFLIAEVVHLLLQVGQHRGTRRRASLGPPAGSNGGTPRSSKSFARGDQVGDPALWSRRLAGHRSDSSEACPQPVRRGSRRWAAHATGSSR
jgi:hypothetical protein